MERLGRYEILEELGRGAMGVVFRAFDPTIGREIALKTIKISEVTDPGLRERQRERLFREARSAGALSHPNIVTIYDIAEENGVAYIAMEFVNGPTLDRVLSEPEPMNQERLFEILRQTAEGLDYAHRKGIIHRDVKPANLMLNESGLLKIADFGIAKVAAIEQLTQSGLIMGTPNYMSPEQVQGKPLDGRADQYSLCVIAYEMLTGERPFEAEQLPTMVYKIVCEEPPPPRRINPSLGEDVDQVLRKGLSKMASDRYESCLVFVRELEAACERSPGWMNLSRGGSLALPTLPPEAISTAPLKGDEMMAMALQNVTLSAPTVEFKPVPEEPPRVESPDTKPHRDLPPPPRFRAMESEAEPPSRTRIWLPLVLLALGAAGGTWFFWGDISPGPAASDTAKTEAAPDPTPPATDPAAPPQTPPASDGSSPPPKSDPAAAAPPVAAAPQGEAKSDPPPSPVTQTKPAVEAPKAESGKAEPKTEIEAPVRYFNLAVKSDPPGARAVFDGLAGNACFTPCSLRASTGSHTLTLSLSGYQTSVERIQLSDGENNLPVYKLRKPEAAILLTSDPSGAEIHINGELWKQITPARLDLSPGRYKIRVSKGNFQGSQDVEVKDGEIETVLIRMASQ